MSSRIFTPDYAGKVSSYTLDTMQKEKKALLTVKFDRKMLAEFYAGVDILGGRSASDFVHNFVRQTIEDAKKLVSKDEFAKLTELKLKEAGTRSKQRRRRGPAANEPRQAPHSKDKAA